MKRLQFIQNSLVLGLASNFLFSSELFANSNEFPDLVVAKGDSLVNSYNLSIKALGGLEKYNLKRKRILIKPTISWNATPDKKLNTNPELIGRIIRNCYDAGAWEVYVLEHTYDDWRKCYKNSGIEKATKQAFGKIIPANEIEFYNNVESNDEYHFHEIYHKCDLLINVPKLNFDEQSIFSGAIKNLHGLTFENANFRTEHLSQKLASILSFCKPVLNIVDASFRRKGDDKNIFNMLITGENMISVDAYACQLLGIKPEEVEYLSFAAEIENCELNTNHLSIQKIFT